MASLMDSHSSRPEALRSLGAAPPGGERGQKGSNVLHIFQIQRYHCILCENPEVHSD